jgi:adenine-specific DNA-methyltransferase
MGIETSNLYTAFVALSLRALRTGGELIAITPRSFCNGPYFTPFRKDLLRLGSLTHVHTFGSRDVAFGDDEVLQENVVFRVERGVPQTADVTVEWSAGGSVEHVARRTLPYTQVVHPSDPDSFIHIAADDWDSRIATMVEALSGKLELIGVQVSTGRVVDFRVKEFLREKPEDGSVPLIYPTHLAGGAVAWPKEDSRKPNALKRNPSTEDQLNPMGVYVLVKRFSSKEERRRIVASVFTPDAAPGEFVAFENHLNYFHQRGRGMPRVIAHGLSAYLNSTLVDSYFRQFNGHTQVNATDLRKLPYPSVEQLERIADRVGEVLPAQSELDEIVEGEILDLAKTKPGNRASERRIEETIRVLKALGLPKEQTNERAALTLLALLDLGPRNAWARAKNPLCGVTPIMEFAATNFGKHWKPNTRETVRRFTLHQFQDAGLVVPNPDKPGRPINSPAYCYQVPEGALALLRTFGTSAWDRLLRKYLASAPALADRYASEREMSRIPLRTREGQHISLSPGGQNELIGKVITEFCPRFTPGATTLYVGDADEKWAHFDKTALKALNVSVDSHGKMPDVVVHFTDKNWLVLVEAVTSHGPVNAKRRGELKKLFASSSAPLVYVTAFLSRQALLRHLGEIAWETEVWVAEAPSHMIHFNGERFLGPYES